MFSSLSFAVENSKSVFTDPSTDGEAKQVNTLGTDTQQKDAFIDVVKWGVNRVLGILALIALIFLIYGGFQMVTSGGDDKKYEAGFTILKHAAIGLILIGVAWFVISLVFWLVNKTASNAGAAGTEQ